MNTSTRQKLNWDANAAPLKEQHYVEGNVGEYLSSDIFESELWEEFLASWSHLEEDPYMADGGTYRSRRYAEFLIGPSGSRLELLPTRPFRQSKTVNYLNGDIDRYYRPISTATLENLAFKQVVLGCAKTLSALHPGAAWKAQIFQNRIVASPNQFGKPTPEGIHRDGVDYVVTMLSAKSGVHGGESSTYSSDGVTRLSSKMLAEPGDFVLLDDQQTMHGVTPIECITNELTGFRDVMVVMYSEI